MMRGRIKLKIYRIFLKSHDCLKVDEPLKNGKGFDLHTEQEAAREAVGGPSSSRTRRAGFV